MNSEKGTFLLEALGNPGFLTHTSTVSHLVYFNCLLTGLQPNLKSILHVAASMIALKHTPVLSVKDYWSNTCIYFSSFEKPCKNVTIQGLFFKNVQTNKDKIRQEKVATTF